MSNPIEHELALVRDENIRLRHVIAKADEWRETLNLPQQDLGCLEFNNAFADYDEAREEIADLIPQQRCSAPDCDELSFRDKLCEDHHPDEQ